MIVERDFGLARRCDVQAASAEDSCTFAFTRQLHKQVEKLLLSTLSRCQGICVCRRLFAFVLALAPPPGCRWLVAFADDSNN